MSGLVKLRGCTHFRQRVVCSVLSGRPLRIDAIRVDDEQPGLRDFEASFLRLVEKLTNGTRIEIDETGTILRFKPGFITGGKLEHDCGATRAIGYFIEGILPMLPFAKVATHITFYGITNDDVDLSVDTLRNVTLPLMWYFGVHEGLELKVKRRGAPPGGGGMVIFRAPIVRELKPIQIVDPGFVKRIRGVAHSTRVSPQLGNRIVDKARSLLNHFIPDVYIFTDHFKGPESGASPGYGLSLVAETTTGHLLSAEMAASGGTLPEDLGLKTAELLCEEIAKGGCVDTNHQSLMMMLMVLCPEDVSKLRVGKLSAFSVQTLRHLRDFFGIMFKITPDPANSTVLLSCLGVGYKNVARRST